MNPRPLESLDPLASNHREIDEYPLASKTYNASLQDPELKMIPEEAIPLVEQIDTVIDLLKNKECDDIVSYLRYYRSRITNDFTAKFICKDLAGMCHPKVWGDRCIAGLDRANWLIVLNGLHSACSSTCHAIEKRQEASP